MPGEQVYVFTFIGIIYLSALLSDDVCLCVNPVKRNNSPLSPTCFTFAREPIHHEPAEMVRMAGVPNVAGRHRRSKTTQGVAGSQSQTSVSQGVPGSQSQTSVSSSSSASDCRDPSTDSKPPSLPCQSVDVKPVIGKQRRFMPIYLLCRIFSQ